MQPGSNVSLSFLSLFWSGYLSGADGPDGLVSDDNFAPIVNRALAGVHLSLNHGIGGASLSFLKFLANAQDDVKTLF
jgi:hypothetical protein